MTDPEIFGHYTGETVFGYTWHPTPFKLGGDFDSAVPAALKKVREDFRHSGVFYYDSRAGLYFVERTASFCLTPTKEPEHEGSCFIWPADSLEEARARYLANHYNGESNLPKWIEDGAQVRVKATPELRRHGLRTSSGEHKADCVARPKEIGTIRRREGNGWWCWVLAFERGRVAQVDVEMLKCVSRIRK